ncbi:MAG: hypothetical protein ACOYOV_00100 [Bacteroidales bacterium]
MSLSRHYLIGKKAYYADIEYQSYRSKVDGSNPPFEIHKFDVNTPFKFIRIEVTSSKILKAMYG